VTTALFLLAAGVVAGVIGTAGGITSLVAYPALLAVGVPALAANVTNSVALLGSGASSALRARGDLDGHGATLRRWLPVTVVVSAVGAVLLLVTPAHVFDRIVPFLVAGVLMIAVMLLDGEPVLHRANALKNVLLLAADIVPAVLFAVSGTVVWAMVWPLGAGAVIGGLIGPSVARRVPQTPLRIAIAVCGFVLAGYLLVAG